MKNGIIYPKPKKEEYGELYYKSDIASAASHFDFYYENKENTDHISFLKNTLFGKEEYEINVSDKGILVSYATEEGRFRALTSLYMLINKQGQNLFYCTVHDKPDFKRRGYMLDISRCRMPKPETIKKLIDLLALLKYNEFQLYMESFCFKYPSFPEYTESFDCLTPEDIKELDFYCRERYIDLVPNQNCFGHMHEWLKKPELSHLELTDGREGSGTINPLIPESFEVVSKIFDSLLPCFSSEFVNVGMDEAFGLGKYQSEEYCREHGADNLFMDWLSKVNELTVSKCGKKPMFWADMIIHYEDIYKRIPKDAIALEWGYELIQSQVMAEHCMAFRNKGVKFYVCPSCNTHFSFTGRSDVTTFNLRTAGEVGRKYGAEGYLVTDWGCGGEGHPTFPVWSLLPCALGGQYAWNVGAEQDGETFKADFIRAAKEFMDDYKFGGKNISEYLFRAANYYLLEPERIHLGSMCGELLQYPLNVTNYAHLFDLKDCPYEFYFNNVTEYMKKIVKDIDNTEFDDTFKREMLVNCNSVILSSELCKVRIGKALSEEEKDCLIRLIDSIYSEYSYLWSVMNYEKGIETFLNILQNRKKELKNL